MGSTRATMLGWQVIIIDSLQCFADATRSTMTRGYIIIVDDLQTLFTSATGMAMLRGEILLFSIHRDVVFISEEAAEDVVVTDENDVLARVVHSHNPVAFYFRL